MSTLVENVAKVTAAHAALKEAIAAKGVAVPEGTKLTDMPALVEKITASAAPNYHRAVFSYDSSAHIDVPKSMVVDTVSMTDIGHLFDHCVSLVSLTLPDGFGQHATNIYGCFNYCRSLASLTLPEGFGSVATNLGFLFSDCWSLNSLMLPTGFGQSATSLINCFYGCTSLVSLILPDGFGQNASSIVRCFGACRALTALTLPSGFGKSATDTINCFQDCASLTDISGNPNFKVSLNLSTCTQLTHDSLMVVINGLQEVTTAQTLTLGTANLSKLTEDEKKVATDKGWTLA